MGNPATKYLAYDMRGKICIVTGANTGIGKETARMLAGDGAHVILACRSTELGMQAMEDIKKVFPHSSMEVIQLDLGDFDSVRRFVKIVSKFTHLDILVNNAGIFRTTFQCCKSGHEMTLAVNHLGVFLLTTLLLPLLEKSPKTKQTTTSHDGGIDGPRIVMVSADVYTLAGPLQVEQLMSVNEGSFRSIPDQLRIYGRSKLCNLLFAEELNTRFKEYGSNIIVNSLQPGRIQTDVNRERVGNLFETAGAIAAKTPHEGGLCLLFVACDPSLNGMSGKFFVGPFEEGVLRDFACNQKVAKELWDFSEEAVQHRVEKWF